MSYEQDRRDDGGASGHAGREPTAPGKRAHTDRIVQRAPTGGADLGRKRDATSFDQAGAYGESRTTIDHAAPEDPLGFLDDERARHHGKRHGKRRGGAHGGAAHGQEGQHADGAASAGPKKLRAEITNVEPNHDQADEGRTLLTVGVGTKHGVTADATFQLLNAGGSPLPGGALQMKEQRGVATDVSSRLTDDKIVARVATGAKVLVTIPVPKEPELNPDGSIGDDLRGFEV